jgi:hypothetical protein
MRPKRNDEYLAQFRVEMEMIFTEYPLDRIINSDETRWKIIIHRMVTVVSCGAQAIACEFEGNLKADIRVLTSIHARGSKLP